jgi:hypothetical protein
MIATYVVVLRISPTNMRLTSSSCPVSRVCRSAAKPQVTRKKEIILKFVTGTQ